MVYESEFYTSRRPYSTITRPTYSSYSVTPYFDRLNFDDNFSYNYYSPISRIYTPSYSRVSAFTSRAPIRYDFDSEYADIPYHGFRRVIPVPMTRITTSPTRIYRDRTSPIRVITPSARIFRRDVSSPVRVITSPARIVSIRVRPSVLSREFDRIEHKYRSSPIGFMATNGYLNSPYSTNFSDETRDIRASTKKLMKEIHETVPRVQGISRYSRASSVPSYSRFDPDLIDKYGTSLIDNEFYVNKNILRPTRKTRDRIELLSNIIYNEPSYKRFTGISHLASARIVGDKPYYTRASLAHDFDPTSYRNDKVRNDVNYLSYYSKNRDAVAADETVGYRAKKQTVVENKPLVIAKPIVLNKNKIQTVSDVVESKSENIVSIDANETPASG